MLLQADSIVFVYRPHSPLPQCLQLYPSEKHWRDKLFNISILKSIISNLKVYVEHEINFHLISSIYPHFILFKLLKDNLIMFNLWFYVIPIIIRSSLCVSLFSVIELVTDNWKRRIICMSKCLLNTLNIRSCDTPQKRINNRLSSMSDWSAYIPRERELPLSIVSAMKASGWQPAG